MTQLFLLPADINLGSLFLCFFNFLLLYNIMPKAINFQTAARQYRQSARGLLRSNGLGIKASAHRISGVQPISCKEIPVNPAHDLRDEATIFLIINGGELNRAESKIQASKYLVGQFNNRHHVLRINLDLLISGRRDGDEIVFRWPKEIDPRVASLCEELEHLQSLSYSSYVDLFGTLYPKYEQTLDLVMRASPNRVISDAYSIFGTFLKPALFDEVISKNDLFNLHKEIPEAASEVLFSSFRAITLINGLAQGFLAWADNTTDVPHISPKVIKRFTKMPG